MDGVSPIIAQAGEVVLSRAQVELLGSAFVVRDDREDDDA